MRAFTTQVRISTEALPGSTSFGRASKVHHGAEPDVGALGLELFTQGVGTLVEEVTIERGGSSDGVWEGSDTVIASNAGWTVMRQRPGKLTRWMGAMFPTHGPRVHPIQW